MGAADLLTYVRAAGFTLDLADDKLLVTPASMLTDELRTALRASKPEVLALLAVAHEANAEAFCERAIMEFDGGMPRADAEAAARQCVDCEFFGRRRTCLEPVAAGLLTQTQGFGIVWPPDGHSAGCAAFTSKAPSKATDRPYRLSAAEGDAAHATAWDDASVSLFIRRTERLQRQGFRDSDAEDLAERLHLRDVQQDGRALCLECRYLTGTTATAWRCGNHKSASVPHNLAGDLVTLLQRCPAFSRGSA